MTKIVLTFGIIAGLICIGMFFLGHPGEGESMNFDNSQITGYVTMIISLSSIFFAVKQYRDNHLDGNINFGKAFQVGILITLVAGIVYVLGWEIYYNNYGSNFSDQYVEYLKTQKADEGLSAAQIEEELAETISMMESYKSNMPMRMGLTFLEIFPVGLVISLICGFIFGKILKPKPEVSY